MATIIPARQLFDTWSGRVYLPVICPLSGTATERLPAPCTLGSPGTTDQPQVIFNGRLQPLSYRIELLNVPSPYGSLGPFQHCSVADYDLNWELRQYYRSGLRAPINREPPSPIAGTFTISYFGTPTEFRIGLPAYELEIFARYPDPDKCRIYATIMWTLSTEGGSTMSCGFYYYQVLPKRFPELSDIVDRVLPFGGNAPGDPFFNWSGTTLKITLGGDGPGVKAGDGVNW